MSSVILKCAEFSNDFEINSPFDRGFDTLLTKTVSFLQEEVRETQTAIAENIFEDIVDGFGDVAFIALNGIYKTFRERGETHEVAAERTIEVMNRICAANLNKKQEDGTILYEKGKVQKPEGWQPPSYADLA